MTPDILHLEPADLRRNTCDHCGFTCPAETAMHDECAQEWEAEQGGAA